MFRKNWPLINVLMMCATCDFTVEDIDELVSRLIKHGAQLVGEVVRYENSYKLCYIRAKDGLLIGLAEQLSNS